MKRRGRTGTPVLGGPGSQGARGQGMGLTVAWQIEDQVDHKRDKHAGNQDVNDVEEWLAADDEVEGDVLVAGAVHRDTGVHITLGCPVYYLPLTIL